MARFFLGMHRLLRTFMWCMIALALLNALVLNIPGAIFCFMIGAFLFGVNLLYTILFAPLLLYGLRREREWMKVEDLHDELHRARKERGASFF